MSIAISYVVFDNARLVSAKAYNDGNGEISEQTQFDEELFA
jgi:hypothetical protein